MYVLGFSFLAHTFAAFSLFFQGKILEAMFFVLMNIAIIFVNFFIMWSGKQKDCTRVQNYQSMKKRVE